MNPCKTCNGTTHCCHLEKTTERIRDEDSRKGFILVFDRTRCKNCGLWISDQVVEQSSKSATA